MSKRSDQPTHQVVHARLPSLLAPCAVLLAIFQFDSASAQTGATFYVATTGNDANPGSSAAPWKTIQHAANTVAAGATVDIRGGKYNESVTINVSGSASAGYITFQSFPGETAIVDGTGLKVSGETGLINIIDQSYIKVVGLEVRNYATSSTSNVPVGIWITGADSYIQILKNHIHDIKTSAKGCNANALGLAAYGTDGAHAINNLTIDGNELDHLTLGCSESLAVDGNVQYWSVTNNIIHDNNNIAIDAIGFENVSSNTSTDQARDGVISGNTVYNITSYGNPAYGKEYSSDGIYCDGCTRVTIERNVIHNTDFGVEVASEWSGKRSSYVTVRNNLIYSNNAAGLTIGGYDSGRGGTDHCNFVNNSFYNDDTKNTGAGEFQIQYYSTNNIFENNIVYAGAQNLFTYGYTSSSGITADYNVYYSSGGAANSDWTWKATSYTGYSAYKTASGQDAHSVFANPQYVSLTTPDLHVTAASPAKDAGNNLGSTVVGTVDVAGNARVQGARIDIGAYEQ
ncbi:MAG: choice-of-anchor Q domain-containing protein [Steroidobacteraceae bacterium]